MESSQMQTSTFGKDDPLHSGRVLGSLPQHFALLLDSFWYWQNSVSRDSRCTWERGDRVGDRAVLLWNLGGASLPLPSCLWLLLELFTSASASQPAGERYTNAPGSKPITHSSVVGRKTQALEPGRPGFNSELHFWLFKQSNNNYKCFAYSVFAYDHSNCQHLSSNITRVTSSEKISSSRSLFFFFPLHITFLSLKLF